MTHDLPSTNPAERLADLAALHCILLPEQGSDRDRALAAAADCFHLANWWPGEAEVAEEFLALAALLPADDAKQSPAASAPPQRARKPRQPTPDGLKTAAQAGAKRTRRRSLSDTVKQMRDAGTPVRRALIEPDGTWTIEIGEPESTEQANPWFAEIEK